MIGFSLLLCCLACAVQQKPIVTEANQSGNETQVSKLSASSNAGQNTFEPKKLECGDFAIDFRRMANDIKCEAVDGYELQNETDKPDSTLPEHLQIKLIGYRERATSIQPEILVFRMSQLRNALAKSQEYIATLDTDVSTIKAIIADGDHWKDKELPSLPWVDAHQDSHTHQKRLDFLNGSGIVFLVQFNVEPSLINNEQLEYEFQGFANDGDTFVTGSFPVRSSTLPETSAVTSIPGYSIPEDFYGLNYDANKKAFQNYLKRINGKLAGMNSAQFEPDLESINVVLKSIKIGK